MINGNTKISDLSDDLENQNELKHKAHEYGSIDKDFYDKLPEWTSYSLDNIDKKFYGRPWFEEAWQKYRDHVMNSEMKNIRAPGYVFNDYIKKDKDLNPTDIRYGLEGDYYLYPELRSEKERKEDAKAICYSEEDINSLKHFEETEHPRGKDGKFVAKGYTKADEERAKLLIKENTLMIAEAKNKELKEASEKREAEEIRKSVEFKVNNVNDLGKGVKNVASGIDTIIQSSPGPETKNIYGHYPELDDKYMNDRINRINLEKRYSDAVGDTKTVMTGKGKAHEALQTINGLVGAATGIAALIIAIKGRP